MENNIPRYQVEDLWRNTMENDIPRYQVEELLEWLRRMHAMYYPPGWDFDPLSAVIEEIERMLE